MPDAPKLRTLSGIIYEQTEAQWAADQRVFGSNVQLVPIDGLNAGKHKLADGIHTYAELNFVENASSGGSPGGSNTQVQYNNAGSFGGITNGTTGQVLKAGTPPAFGTQEADDVTVDRYFVLSSGSIATSTFVQTGTQNGKGVYTQVGGTATAVWDDPGSGLQWNITSDGSEILYSSTENVADPTLVTTWTAEAYAANPLPSLSVLYGPTVQDALEQEAKALVNAFSSVAQRTGSAIAFDQAAIYNTAASPSSGTITYDLTGATFGVEVIAYFNHASLPTFPSGTEVIGTWDDSEVNEVRFVYGASGEVVATIRSNNTGDYVSPTTNLRPTTDQSTSGTTAVGITGMSMTLKANKSYRVQGKLRVQGTGTGGLKFQATLGAASPAVVLWLHLLGRSLATSNTGLLSDQMNVAAGYNTLSGIAMSPNTSAAGYVFFDGTIDVDNADVTFGLAFASATSGQTATVFRTASHLEVTEI